LHPSPSLGLQIGLEVPFFVNLLEEKIMIGQRIKQARSAAGLSLRTLAAQIGVSPPVLRSTAAATR
jgi:hypothetical protein